MNKKLIKNARNLRKNAPDAEKILWRYLRNRQVMDMKFRRQVPIGKYIVDFCCHEKRLIIELDGGQHTFNGNIERDTKRQKHLEEEGYKVLRFWNTDIFLNIDGVLQNICRVCKDN